MYLTWPGSLSFVSASLRLHFPPGRSGTSSRHQWLLDLAGETREQLKAPREASRRPPMQGEHQLHIAASVSIHGLKFGLFLCFFLFVYFYAINLPELVQSMRCYRGFLGVKVISVSICWYLTNLRDPDGSGV